jgi:uncharacterized phage protein gp47/JayE
MATTPALTTFTTDQIRDGMLRDMRVMAPGVDTSAGKDTWLRFSVIANALAPAYANATYLSNQIFPNTCDPVAYLPLHAAIDGIPKAGAAYASGQATVSASYPQTVGDGALLVNQTTGNLYKTVGAVSISLPALTATANVIALSTGSGYDVDDGTTLSFTAPPPGVNLNAIVISLKGGAEAQTDAQWAQSVLLARRSRPAAGNIAQCQALGDSVVGVEKTFPYPALRGPGTLDIVVTTSAASGSRVAGTALLSQVVGAFQAGIQTAAGTFVPGIPDDVFENLSVNTVNPQPTKLVLNYEASANNPFDVWPATIDGTNVETWYAIVEATSLSQFYVLIPFSGAPAAPVAGNSIGVFFPSVGFASAKIAFVSTATVSGMSTWAVTVGAWSTSSGGTPTESAPPCAPLTVTYATVASAVAAGSAVITPWCSQLYAIAGSPAAPSRALTGAVPAYFSGLGPGEMTPLTSDDVVRRRRFPRPTDLDPSTGKVAWPTDVTGRLTGAILDATDGNDASISPFAGSAFTPTVPAGSVLGQAPWLLTLSTIIVCPASS